MIDLSREHQRNRGTRGGLEQFQWDSVKGQTLRDRECYLGQSVRIGTQGAFGRFQRHDWWQKKHLGMDTDERARELAHIREVENRLRGEALGVHSKNLLLAPAAAYKYKMAKTEEEEEPVAESVDSIRVKVEANPEPPREIRADKRRGSFNGSVGERNRHFNDQRETFDNKRPRTVRDWKPEPPLRERNWDGNRWRSNQGKSERDMMSKGQAGPRVVTRGQRRWQDEENEVSRGRDKYGSVRDRRRPNYGRQRGPYDERSG